MLTDKNERCKNMEHLDSYLTGEPDEPTLYDDFYEAIKDDNYNKRKMEYDLDLEDYSVTFSVARTENIEALLELDELKTTDENCYVEVNATIFKPTLDESGKFNPNTSKIAVWLQPTVSNLDSEKLNALRGELKEHFGMDFSTDSIFDRQIIFDEDDQKEIRNALIDAIRTDEDLTKEVNGLWHTNIISDKEYDIMENSYYAVDNINHTFNELEQKIMMYSNLRDKEKGEAKGLYREIMDTPVYIELEMAFFLMQTEYPETDEVLDLIDELQLKLGSDSEIEFSKYANHNNSVFISSRFEFVYEYCLKENCFEETKEDIEDETSKKMLSVVEFLRDEYVVEDFDRFIPFLKEKGLVPELGFENNIQSGKREIKFVLDTLREMKANEEKMNTLTQETDGKKGKGEER